MKATGIVRRIDDLGRVIIPKEIRRTMNITEGDPLEIYTHEDAVCFKKYDVNGNYRSDIANIINNLKDDNDVPNAKDLIKKLQEIMEML